MKKVYTILLIFFLWGCQSNNDYTQAPISEQVTLWTAQDIGFWQALGKEFDIRLEDVLLEFHVQAFDSNEELQTTLINTMAEGESPDIILTDSDWVIKNTKKLIPFPTNDVLNTEKYKQDFYPVTYHLLRNDEIWGIPIGVDSLAFFYNKSSFTENIAGEEILEKGITWKEVLEINQVLSQKDNSFSKFLYSGVALGRNDNISHGSFVLQNMIFQKTKTFYAEGFHEYVFASQEEQESSTKKINHGTTAAEVFFIFSDENSPYYSWSQYAASKKGMKDLEAFVEKKVASIFGTVQDIQTIKGLIHSKRSQGKESINDLNFGVAPFPKFSKEEEALIGKVSTLAVPRTAKNTERAWEFLLFAIKKENQRSAFLSTHIPSARQDLFPEQESVDRYGIFVQQIRRTYPLLHPLPNTEIETLFREYINNINDKKENIDQGLKNIENKLNETLRQDQGIGDE